ncbi:MAG: ATP-dependent helicase, partial [Actinomycetota bacterium]|nr:ATP-dependent helicase [Actinomycetota bacterium]
MTSYTEGQTEAIDCLDQPLQIIACAGSGKTQVISERTAAILRTPGAEPRNVVAFTFTEKAAAELKNRVYEIVGEQTVGLAEMYIGTMHGYCLDLLQRLVPETFKFSALTDVTNRMLIDRNSKMSGLTSCPTTALNVPYLRRYQDSKLYQQVTSVLREDNVDEGAVPDEVWTAFADYMKLLYDHNYFDYTEMIHLAVKLLEGDPADPDCGSEAKLVQDHIAADIRYVVVDEYQDVNPLQERLIKGLTRFGANLCVVGDDDQTIYQWRGSEVSNIVTFADRYTDVRQLTLADNFRSSEGIVEVARSVAELISVEKRLSKNMVAAGCQEYERGDLLALDFPNEVAEAAWICDQIETMRGLAFADNAGMEPRGLSWSDFAVLYRSVAGDAGPLVEEMRRRSIPHVVKGLNRLFDTPEIQAVVAVFQYMVSEIDATALQMAWDT